MLKGTQQNGTSRKCQYFSDLSSTLSIASHLKLPHVVNTFPWLHWHWILPLRSLILSLLVVNTRSLRDLNTIIGFPAFFLFPPLRLCIFCHWDRCYPGTPCQRTSCIIGILSISSQSVNHACLIHPCTSNT